MELVLNLKQNEFRIHDESTPTTSRRYSGAMVSGAYSRCFLIDTAAHANIIGVHFRPGGACLFLNLPASEIRDQHVDLDMIWGEHATELRYRLQEAKSTQFRFHLLETALKNHLARGIQRHRAVSLAVRALENHPEEWSVRDLAERLGMSQRAFIQAFKEQVGVTPKLFSRLRRFQRALSKLERDESPDWLGLATDCGYFDQSHLIHDFRTFSNLTPTAYARLRSHDVKENHIIVPT